MSDNKILKSLIFGDEFDEDISGLNLLNLGLGFGDFNIENDDFKNKKKKAGVSVSEPNKTSKKMMKKLGNRKDNKRESDDSDENLIFQRNIAANEKDLNLKLICLSDGEKIYKLSDLFIPRDEKVTKKIEKYNFKIMSISEKDKQDKEADTKEKKEINDCEEIKHIIKKAKRNQKFTKINVTFNEKFFDRTFFLENINTINANVHEKEHQAAKDYSEGDLKRITVENKIDEKLVETNLLNSLFYVKMKLNADAAETQTDQVDDYEVGKINEAEFENRELDQLNKSIRTSIVDTSQLDDITQSLNLSELKVFNLQNSFILNESVNMAEFSFLNKKRPRAIFQKEIEKNDLSSLYDKVKNKKHRQQGFSNESLFNGDYLSCIQIDDEVVNPRFKEISQKIFDTNDYNMNFELLQTQDQQQAQANNLKKETPIMNSDDFYNNINAKNIPGNINQQTTQSVLKIGKAKGNLLTHAKCAYNLTYNKINLTYEDLRDFHRPNFCKYLLKEKKKRAFTLTISNSNYNMMNGDKSKRWDVNILTRNYLRKKEKKSRSKNVQYMNAYEIFKDRYKLSLVDGKYALFEHIDEYPLFLDSFGMASKLKKFLYTQRLFNSNVANQTSKLSDTELKTYNSLGPYGSQIPLQPNQKLPLIGQIDQNELKGLSVIDNKMYRAPVFYEKLTNPTVVENKANETKKKYYNFLITFKKSKEGKESFFLRELDNNYVVAQEEPKIEVYPPQSRQYNLFLKKKIQTYTYKLYDEIGYKAGINFKVFTSLFPNVTEQILKKNFREMKIEMDKNICYFTKIPNEDNQMLITPENICQYESCQFGIYKLREVGIKNLTNPDKISYAVNKFIQQTPDVKQQFLAKVIEEELLTTPWNITQNFLQAKQIKGMLAIKGIGDPSNGQGGYSFLKMPVKTYNDNKTLKEEMDMLKIANKNIKTVTGTDADLRKLSKEDIKLKLIQLGYEEEYINKLSRWERVALLRYKSSEASKLGYEGDITKYARGQRMNSKLQRDAYQKNINDVFKKQINYITNEDIANVDSDESDNDDINNLPVISYKTEVKEEEPHNSNFMTNLQNKKKKKTESKRINLITDNSHNTKQRQDGKIIKLYKKNETDDINVTIPLILD